MPHEPIEEQYQEMMRVIAKVLDECFNGNAKGEDRQTGFVLLVFPFGEAAEGRCNYLSNGASRKDMISLFRETAARFEGQAETKGRA